VEVVVVMVVLIVFELFVVGETDEVDVPIIIN